MSVSKVKKIPNGVREIFEVSWWDEEEGIGIAVNATGQEFVLHRANLSTNIQSNLNHGTLISASTILLSENLIALVNVRSATVNQREAMRANRLKSMVDAA